MKNTITALLIMIFGGLILGTSPVFAEAQKLSATLMDAITGEQGIRAPNGLQPPPLEAYAERNADLKREILFSDPTSGCLVKSTNAIFIKFNNHILGKASGKTFDDLMDEAMPEPLSPFFMNYAQSLLPK